MNTKKNRKFRNKTARIYAIPSCDKDIVGVIDVNAIRHNIKYLKKKSGTDLMPVLKADAYGHGAVEIAKILRKLGIKYIGVATLGEAIMLDKKIDIERLEELREKLEALISSYELREETTKDSSATRASEFDETIQENEKNIEDVKKRILAQLHLSDDAS